MNSKIAGVTFGKSSAEGVPAENIPDDKPAAKRFLVMRRIYGSFMGDVPDDVDSKRTYYYYNVDGKEVGYGASLISEIPIGDIQLISVLNEKSSIAKYGEKAKDGAIEITTKKK